jgi:hypothetical protein
MEIDVLHCRNDKGKGKYKSKGTGNTKPKTRAILKAS